METTQQIKDFALNFFTNLDAAVSWKGEVMLVEKAPKEFEAFIGKKAPYLLAFSAGELTQEVELLTKGSHFLKGMTSFLDTRGQTSLFKLFFEVDPKSEMQGYFNFPNSELTTVTKKTNYSYFFRFTFQTTFQYQSDKEQALFEIFVKNGEVIQFDTGAYSIIEGKKEEIALLGPDIAYAIAKAQLREQLNPKIQEISAMLSIKLEKEMARIRELYISQKNENELDTKKTKEQIKSIEQEIQKGSESDKILLELKLQKINEHLQDLTRESNVELIKKEEEFFIADEMRKHSLNIANKLVNTSVFYYPVYEFSAFLKNSNTSRMISTSFNPLTKSIKPLQCDSCKKDIKEVVLCSLGHACCNSCLKICDECKKPACSSCLTKVCSTCGKKLCKKCAARCPRCNKSFCKIHLKRDYFTGESGCSSCLKSCSACGQFSDPAYAKPCPSCGKLFCGPCEKQSVLKTNGEKTSCIFCSKTCKSCLKVYPKEEFPKCGICKTPGCLHEEKCVHCRKETERMARRV